MIKVACQGKIAERCDKAYNGCKNQIMYSETDHKIVCKNGKLIVTKDKTTDA